MGNLKSIALMLLAGSVAHGAQPYSPHADIRYPESVYFGDTHVHTYLSGDAFGMGTRLTPDDAYAFAKGAQVTATGGDPVRLGRPLDFLLIADHAEYLGIAPRVAAGDARLLASADGRRWSEFFADVPSLQSVLNAPSLDDFNAGSKALMAGKSVWNGDYPVSEGLQREVWHEVIDAAERHNDPGTFTAFVGYEYSSNPPMLHRNVLFAGGPESTRQTLPFSKYDSPNPEDLWAHLDEFEERTGSAVISIPHNPNLSRGRMFRPTTHAGAALTAAAARVRADREPVLEVTQIKGDSETHPLASPDDPFADYETWKGAGWDKTEAPDAWVAGSYARPALKQGLEVQSAIGANPFKFGMIGSTDTHNGVATAAEDNFWGKMATNEPGPYRVASGAIFTASGYAAVWAEANTREAIFAAFKRREVYATTGPRITLRFFGGWDYTEEDALLPISLAPVTTKAYPWVAI